MQRLFLLFVLLPAAGFAADPAPFEDLESGLAAPQKFKSVVFRKKLLSLRGENRNILKHSYYYDYIKRRYLLQPGLPQEAVIAIDRILKGKRSPDGFWEGLWRGFVQVNSEIQHRVALLLKRVVLEHPLSSLRLLSDGSALGFTSPATGGVRLLFRQGTGFRKGKLSCRQPGSVALVRLTPGGFLAAVLDRATGSLLVRSFRPSGEVEAAPVSIPFVAGERLHAAALTDRRVLFAWQKGDGVHGGYFDAGTGKFRRFQPLSGYSLPEQYPGRGGLFLFRMRDRFLYRLSWDGERGVLPLRPLYSLPAEGPFSVFKEDSGDTLLFAEKRSLFRRGGGRGVLRRIALPAGGGELSYWRDGLLLIRKKAELLLCSIEGQKLRLPLSAGKTAVAVAGEELLLFYQQSSAGGQLLFSRYRFANTVTAPVSVYGRSALLLILLLFLLSLVYGFVHSAGPGHGKALVAAYFVERPHYGWLPAVKMALIVSATHTGSALLLATFFQLILMVAPDQMAIRKWFTIFSALAVFSLGVYMLISRFQRHSCSRESERSNTGRSMLALGVAAGIVPCPLAMGIMVISIMNGVFFLGVLSAIGMSSGMFVLLLLLGGLTSRSRERLERLLKGRGRWADLLGTFAGVISALVIMVLGVALLAPLL